MSVNPRGLSATAWFATLSTAGHEAEPKRIADTPRTSVVERFDGAKWVERVVLLEAEPDMEGGRR